MKTNPYYVGDKVKLTYSPTPALRHLVGIVIEILSNDMYVVDVGGATIIALWDSLTIYKTNPFI